MNLTLTLYSSFVTFKAFYYFQLGKGYMSFYNNC
jgi:hypothetical protein